MCYLVFFPVELKVKVMIVLHESSIAIPNMVVKYIVLLTNEEAFKKYLVYIFEDWWKQQSYI